MKKLFLHLCMIAGMASLMACGTETDQPSPEDSSHIPHTEGKKLIVYYSYTHHTQEIVEDLSTLIEADVVRIEPADKNLDYAANNYEIGSQQLSSIQANPNNPECYPAIDPVDVDLKQYSTIIVAVPLWWSRMASNMQTFLFQHQEDLAGKDIALIVSSHSSGISGVEEDAKRLIPEGKFLSKSLWINNSNHSKRKALLEEWVESVLDRN